MNDGDSVASVYRWLEGIFKVSIVQASAYVGQVQDGHRYVVWSFGERYELEVTDYALRRNAEEVLRMLDRADAASRIRGGPGKRFRLWPSGHLEEVRPQL